MSFSSALAWKCAVFYRTQTLPNLLNICLVLSWLVVTDLGNLCESII